MTWTWELYQDINGEIPKELLAFFIQLVPEEEKPKKAPKPILNAGESERLRRQLIRLCDKGLSSLKAGVGTFEKLKSEDDLYELRIITSQNNPRFIITHATPQRFIILHAFTKKYKNAIRDRDKNPARTRLRELQQRKK